MVLEDVIRQGYKCVEPYFWLAKCYYHDLMDSKRTEELLRQGLLYEPNNAESLDLLAGSLKDQGKSLSVHLPYQIAAVAAAPTWPHLSEHAVHTLCEVGQWDLAYKIAFEARNCETVEPAPDAISKYFEYVITGRAGMKGSPLQLSKELLCYVEDHDPKLRPDSLYPYTLPKPEDESQDLVNTVKEQLVQHPDNLKLQVLLGILLWINRSDKVEQTVKLLEDAIERGYKNAEVHFWLANCYYHNFNELERAEELLRKGLYYEPNNPECLSLLATCTKEEKEERGEETHPLLYLHKIMEAVKAAPSWPHLREFAVVTLCKLGQWRKAFKMAFAARKCKAIKAPLNPILRYFERNVTGRSTIKSPLRFSLKLLRYCTFQLLKAILPF
ncbi:MAG: tetratricopeptide repeat protein [Verrucomicrobia bacterium]|nr:tetratricopeptide repeat protein [Verrucomicrobiota bacterium]